MDIYSLSLESLADQCKEETEKYRRTKTSDPRYCFELMRRALEDGMNDALTYIMQIYEKQVIRWVYQHPAFYKTGETADFFSSWAFEKFHYYASKEQFARFNALAKALSYLKVCVGTAIMQYLRDFPDRDAGNPPEDMPINTPFEKRLRRREVIVRIQTLLPNPNDQLLMNLVYFQGCKHEMIVAEYPSIWGDSRRVTVALQRIQRTLSKDAMLRSLLDDSDLME